ncbi:hypothetical protein [Stenotrophomonas sp. 2694]|jgi:hypothetical protein|uniref:hypothetical protein n=1 Tax=Stenotrophomonas sp. 2694 TaxID=3156317 RepID=UPI00339A3D37
MQAPQDAKVAMGKGMDTKFLVETPIASQLHVETLTFHGLYTRVQGLIDRSIYPKPSGIERWSMRIAVIAAIVGIVSGLWLVHWVPVSILLPITVTCLLVEIGGFAVNGVLSVLRQYQQYLQPRLSHAKEMDSEFAQWRALVGELQRFPKIEREQRLRFATALRAGMVDRMGLLYGGLQRLGPFPLIVALFVQYQAWKKGGWAGVFDVGLAGGILIFFIALLYVAAWLLISQRTRLDTYINLLEASLQGDSGSEL